MTHPRPASFGTEPPTAPTDADLARLESRRDHAEALLRAAERIEAVGYALSIDAREVFDAAEAELYVANERRFAADQKAVA